jgi:hypothetical protein
LRLANRHVLEAKHLGPAMLIEAKGFHRRCSLSVILSENRFPLFGIML